MGRIKFLILITGIIGGLFLANKEILAQEGISITISPLRFEITANPGDIVTNKVRVYNSSNNTISIKMEAEDFRPVGEAGQVMVAPEEEITYSLKRWVTTEPSEFTLEPKEQKFVDFTISVPENAEPGGKYGSILATITGVVSGDITGTAIAQKVGSLVLLTLSGQVKEDLLVKEFSAPNFSEYGPIEFTMRFENKGSVHVKPKGFITILDWRGKKLVDLEFPQQNVIPGAIRKITTEWNKKWLLGRYTATLVGSYGASNTPIESQVITFWVFPWKIGLGIALGILVVLIILYLTRKRLRLALRVLIKGEKSIQ
jgi:hypothetical protein